jgi:peptidoglycan/LPS O-acetylase OafA/YrhL
LNAKPKKTEAYIFVAWIFTGAGLRFFYKIEGFGFLAVYIALGMFVYICIKANVRLKSIEKLGKSSYAIYLVHFLVLHYLQEIMPLKTGLSTLLVGITLTTFISYFLAFIIFKFIESNVQRFVDVITKPKPTSTSALSVAGRKTM